MYEISCTGISDCLDGDEGMSPTDSSKGSKACLISARQKQSCLIVEQAEAKKLLGGYYDG